MESEQNLRVLVTGGTGVLGRQMVQELRKRGATVRVLSRHAAPSGVQTEWATVNFKTGAGLTEAFREVDVVIHAATSQNVKEDTLLTQQVLKASLEAGVKHALYVSIVGIDPPGFFSYYNAKLESEKLFASSGVPYSIQRATQFHDLVGRFLGGLAKFPVLVLPRGAVLQPVESAAVAGRIAHAALQPPAGRLPDLAGPEVLSVQELAQSWLGATGQQKRIVQISLPLAVFRALAAGRLTSSTAERLGRSWAEWLKEHAEEQNAYQQRGEEANSA